MVLGDHGKSYTELFSNSVSRGYLWNYGAEAWCNLPGQYVTIVADLSSLSGAYEMSICSLGIFGTKYQRATPIETQIKLRPYDSKYVQEIEHIASTLIIGNALDIKIRVKDHVNFAWVSVYCYATYCKITFTRTS